jgi:hypothetical protein
LEVLKTKVANISTVFVLVMAKSVKEGEKFGTSPHHPLILLSEK